MTHLLEVRGLHAGYGDIEVLRGIDLLVPEGSVVALVGANGVGKTTILRTIVGELLPTAGTICLDGASVVGLAPWTIASRGMSMIPEGRGVFSTMTVEDNLRVFADTARAGPAKRAEVLELFPRLRERLHQTAGTMSGGEQQMLALSRAFLAAPRLLLVDELSAGLAPVIVEQLFERLRELCNAGTTVLLVEQYLQHVAGFADICYVVAGGAIGFVGESAEITALDLLPAGG